MPFCHSPWTNLDIDPLGTMAPCCKFQHDKNKQKFNIQTHTIQQYSKSKLLQQVRSEFMQGNWPSGCERCKIEEQNNIEISVDNIPTEKKSAKEGNLLKFTSSIIFQF